MSTIHENIPVLLVDDRPENLITLEGLLEGMNLHLCKAGSGQEALRLCLKEEFALVLMDVQMPEMDGYETAELMRANPKTRQIPIIFVTAGMNDIHAQFKGYESGAVDFLIKPLEPVFLKSKVKVFTELFSQKRELQEYSRILEAKVEERTATLKQVHEQLRQAQKMEAIGTLAGGIAHDFNNILTVVSGYGNLALLELEPEHTLRNNIQQILKASERGEGLSRSLLSFSRKQNMFLINSDLNAIVRDVEEMLKRSIGEDVTLTTSYTDEKLVVLADSQQIGQVIINLATNARDAMPEGGRLHIETSIHDADDQLHAVHNLIPADHFACMKISDSGCGMEENIREKIFEPFFTTKPKERGTGLGLSIVYGIIRQHNGYIHVESKPGEGTVFCICLPLQRSMKETVSSEQLDENNIPKGNGELILIAEDDPSVREMVSQMLVSCNYRIVTAVDGDDAINKYREHSDQIRLILMDVIMPNRTGKDAYDEIRKSGSDVKILFISGYAEEYIKKRTDLDKSSDLVMKPVNPGYLLNKICKMIG